MSGGTYEYVASYLNNGNDTLALYGGNLYGTTTTEQATSTKYKTVYSQSTTSSSSMTTQQADYIQSSIMKGDAIYETSNAYESNTSSWHYAYASYPTTNTPFFIRGGNYSAGSMASIFYFQRDNENPSSGNMTTRLALVFEI